MSRKRPDCIKWDDYFMGTALLASKRTKKLPQQVHSGCCIVNPDGKIIVGVGHDTVIKGFECEASNPDYLCHAITNAVIWANRQNLKDCIIYSITYPCNKCAQLIIQSKMSRVHYMLEKYQCNGEKTTYGQKLLNEAGIPCRNYIPDKDIKINFERMEPTLFDSKL